MSGLVVRRKGFTLIELLVVVAIIGILIAMLLPAIQAAREAARRSACSNNLKQLALACHTYHDTHKELPPVHATSAQASWIFFIFPYMEQRNMYDKATSTGAQGNSTYLIATGTIAGGKAQWVQDFTSAAFVCPTRRGPMLSRNNNGFSCTPTDYAACNSTSMATGCFSNNGSLPPSASQANGSLIEPAQYRNVAGKGAIKSSTNFGSISDGLSYTTLIGEKHFFRGWTLGRSADGDGPCIGYYTNSQSSWSGYMRVGGSSAANGASGFSATCAQGDASGNDLLLYDVNTGPVAGASVTPTYQMAFGSWHPEVVQFAMGDGSVQQIRREDFPPAFVSYMIGRDDGNTWTIDQ